MKRELSVYRLCSCSAAMVYSSGVIQMCGRFSLTAGDRDIEDEWKVKLPWDLPRRYNIAPSQEILALLNDGERRLELFQWGLIPSWAKEPKRAPINARAESVFEKPFFRDAAKKRRCLVLADGFYEWQKTEGGKIPHYARLKSGRPFGFAGIWESWSPPEEEEELHTCAIVTTEPNELMKPIHSRMPVIVLKDLEELWLDPQANQEDLEQVLVPYPEEEMEVYPVSKSVNNPRNDLPECVQPICH